MSENDFNKDFDKNLEDAMRNAVESGYNAHELGIPVEQAVEEVLQAVRMGKALGQHKGPKN